MAWEYLTHEQLVAAGYVWRGESACVKCHARILWYTNPDRHLVPVDPRTYVLHFISCVKREGAVRPANVIEFAERKNRQAKIDFEHCE